MKRKGLAILLFVAMVLSYVSLFNPTDRKIVREAEAKPITLPFQLSTYWHYSDGFIENVTIRIDNTATNNTGPDSLDAEDPPGGPGQLSDAYIKTNWSYPYNELMREARPHYNHVYFHTGESKWTGSSSTWVNVTWDYSYVQSNLADNEILILWIDGEGDINLKERGWYNFTQGPLSIVEFQFKYFVNNPPYQPSNPSPADGATDVSLTPTLSWTGGDPDGDTVTYDVYFGTSPTPPKVASNITATSYNPGTLNPSTTYYWKIVAWDSWGTKNESAVWSFTTRDNNPPYQPSNPNPSDGATGVSLDADLSWTGGDPDGDTVTYDVYFGTSSPPPKVVSNQSSTTYDPGTLNLETTYYWKIVAWDSWGASNESAIWSFTTRGNSPPNAPSNPNPADGATGVSVTTDLSWTCTDPDGDTLTYDVYFGTTNPPPKVSSNQSSNTYDPGTLNYETTYYWKIVAWDTFGESNSSSVWSFTTQSAPVSNNPPNKPTNPNPSDGATGVSIDADLSWTCSDPDGDALTYDVYFGTTTNPPKVASNISANTYDPGTLNYNTTYYWKIVAWDVNGASNESDLWSFTTQEAGAPANQPPVAQFTYTVSNFTVTFDASSSYDPDGSIVNYTWDFGDGNTGYGKIVNHTYSSEGTYTVTLTVKDDDNLTASTSKQIVIGKAPPVANFTYRVENYTVYFIDKSYDLDGEIVSWQWIFGDGSFSNLQNPIHSFPTEGVYMVMLTVTDNDNLSNSVTKIIEIKLERPDISIDSIESNSPTYQGIVWINGSATGDAYVKIIRYVSSDVYFTIMDWTKADEVDTNKWSLEIDTSSWNTGRYSVLAKAVLWDKTSDIEQRDFWVGKMKYYTVKEVKRIPEMVKEYAPYAGTTVATIVGVWILLRRMYPYRRIRI